MKNWKLYGLFFMDGVQLSERQSHYEETVYFLPVSPQEFLVLIYATPEQQNAELTFEPPSCFEPRTPVLGIQRTNHYDNWEDVCLM